MGRTKDIREAVDAELLFDPLVDETDITVANMGGDVALNGTVPSSPQYLEAAAAARRVFGVRNVHNHLEVVLTPDAYRDDPMLTTAANNALTWDIAVPDVAGLIGVRNIKDEIGIQTEADPFDVTLRVQEALDRYSLIPDDSDITVDTSAGARAAGMSQVAFCLD